MNTIAQLKAALRRLQRSGGRVARANARAAVRAAAARILAEMDRAYPIIPKEKKPRGPSKLTGQQRKALRDRRLRARGLVPISEITEHYSAKLADYAAVGIRVRITDNRIWWAPAWTRVVKVGDRATLARCKRSASARAAMLAEAALLQEA